MLSTVALVVAGLSTGHKIGLAAVGLAFIVFALISSFLIPRRDPNFPSRNMPLYVGLCVLFFVAMLGAVLVFGRESSEAQGNESPSATETFSNSLPGQTTTAPATATTSQATTTSGGGGGGVKGDPAAGKTVFTSASCSGCHTLKAAGATGNVGPNLDTLKPSYAAIHNQVIHGGGAMPAFQGQLTAKQIDDVSAFVYTSTHS
jgi:mono/diheme cytochrome c family protein